MGAPATRRFSHEHAFFVGCFCTLAASGGFILSLRELFNPTRLVVSRDGFEHLGARKNPLVRWEDVAEFVVVRKHSTWIIGYRLTEGAKGRQRPVWSSIFRPAGCDGWVSNQWSKPHRLLDLLEGYRQSAVDSDPSRQAIT